MHTDCEINSNLQALSKLKVQYVYIITMANTCTSEKPCWPRHNLRKHRSDPPWFIHIHIGLKTYLDLHTFPHVWRPTLIYTHSHRPEDPPWFIHFQTDLKAHPGLHTFTQVWRSTLIYTPSHSSENPPCSFKNPPRFIHMK